MPEDIAVITVNIVMNLFQLLVQKRNCFRVEGNQSGGLEPGGVVST